MEKTYKTRAELKQEVKELFRGNWWQAIKVSIIPVALQILAMIFLGMIGITALIFLIKFANETDLANYQMDTTSSVSNNFGGSTGGSWVTGILTSLISTGIAFTFLDWLRTKNADFNAIKGTFSVFSRKYFLGVLVVQILVNIFTFLWTLLLIVPGIIKAYAYSQAKFIFKDLSDTQPEQDISYFDCITKSRELMDGHKFELFVLQLSFIGWDILAMIPFGIGYLWLTPYKEATYAAFYKKLLAEK